MPPVIISLVFIAFVIALSAAGPAMLSDPDTAWHLAAGDLIRERGAVNLTDPWSFSAPNHAWRDISWLWDAGMSWLTQHAGLQGPVGFTEALMAMVFAGIAWQCMARGAGLSIIMLVLVTLAINAPAAVRPQAMTFLLALIANELLRHVRTHPQKRSWLAFLPLLTVLWVNCHGGFLIMFILLAAYKFDAFLRRNWRECVTYSAAGAACLLAALINPYGIHIVGAVADTLLSSSQRFIGEWQPMRFTPVSLLWAFPIPLFLLLVRPNDPRFSTAEKIMTYLWLILAAASNRQYFLFLIFSAPMLAVAVEPWLNCAKKNAGWPPAQRLWHTIERQRFAAALLAFIVAFACATPWAQRQFHPSPLRLPPPIDSAIDFIEAHYPDVHFFNAYNFGGYIIYKTHGKIPVFIDGRAQTAYPKQVIDDYMAYFTAAPNWEARLSDYDVGGLFLERSDPAVDRILHRRGWKLVYEDGVTDVFVKEALAK